ncbi:MAG: glycosyltransferase [Cyanobacteria bacterium J06636_16]
MKNILLFDLETTGHHSSYIYYLINYWRKHGLEGTLHVVVAPQFLEQHSDIVAIASTSTASHIQFTAITPTEYETLVSRKNGFWNLKRALQEWHLLARYAERLAADHCLLLYLDRSHLPIILRLHLPCPFSSIYFRPTFHYSTFPSYITRRGENIQAWRERTQIKLGLAHPKAHTLFCLDPFAVEQINQLTGKSQAVYLPDPVPLTTPLTQEAATFRNKLEISVKRKVFLLFGALNRRKGIHEIIEAFHHLSDEQLKSVCFLIVGKLSNSEAALIQTSLEALKASRPIQIVLQDDFVSEETVPTYFHMADIVLAVYQQHVGMSGILVRAAAAEKPTICSDYGLMGEVTRQYQLGLLVDSKSSDKIAEAIAQCLDLPAEKLGDFEEMQSFAQMNSVDNFARTIFDTIAA